MNSLSRASTPGPSLDPEERYIVQFPEDDVHYVH